MADYTGTRKDAKISTMIVLLLACSMLLTACSAIKKDIGKKLDIESITPNLTAGMSKKSITEMIGIPDRESDNVIMYGYIRTNDSIFTNKILDAKSLVLYFDDENKLTEYRIYEGPKVANMKFDSGRTEVNQINNTFFGKHFRKKKIDEVTTTLSS